MAASNIPYSAPLRPSTRPVAPPSPAAVLAYCETHTTAETATHFGINERSVRRIKARVRNRETSANLHGSEYQSDFQSEIQTRSRASAEDHLSSVGIVEASASEKSNVLEKSPRFPDTADDVAGDHTSWKCPATGELLPVIPGTRRKQWEQERRAAHARHVAAVSGEIPQLDPGSILSEGHLETNSSQGTDNRATVAQLDPCSNWSEGSSATFQVEKLDPGLAVVAVQQLDPDPAVYQIDKLIMSMPNCSVADTSGHPDTAPIATGSAETSGHVRAAYPLDKLVGPVPVRSTVAICYSSGAVHVVTRVVRLPPETPRQDLYSRLAALNLDTLAGPQLAIPVAVLLIVLAFGLLG